MSREIKIRLPGWTADSCLIAAKHRYCAVTEFPITPANRSILPQMICRERADGWLECLTKRGRWRIWTGMT
jgi:hypothetical protein